MRRFLVLTVLAVVLPCGIAGEAKTADESEYDWGVAYYLSYDNDLDRNGLPILKMIREGVTTKGTVAAAQMDLRHVGGMHRYTIRQGSLTEERVASEDSASEEEFVAYLKWFASTFRCKKYVVIVLNHGGGLDQMCLDDVPGKSGRVWMSGQALGKRLREFEGMRGRWPLLFLQQCGRGTLENLYSFRGTGEYLMASPLSVGAPNTYYTRFHEWLAVNPEATGLELAARIATLDEHYASYACYRGTALEELPARLKRVTDALTARTRLSPPKTTATVYPAAGTVYVEPFLKDLAAENGVGVKEVDAFVDWMAGTLVANVWFRTPSGVESGRYYGMGIAPPNAATRKEDAGLELLKPSGLGEVWSRLEPKAGP